MIFVSELKKMSERHHTQKNIFAHFTRGVPGLLTGISDKAESSNRPGGIFCIF